jgi:hypothetical protein
MHRVISLGIWRESTVRMHLPKVSKFIATRVDVMQPLVAMMLFLSTNDDVIHLPKPLQQKSARKAMTRSDQCWSCPQVDVSDGVCILDKI